MTQPNPPKIEISPIWQYATAVLTGDRDLLASLLESEPLPKSQCLLLGLACRYSNVGIVRMLVEHGAEFATACPQASLLPTAYPMTLQGLDYLFPFPALPTDRSFPIASTADREQTALYLLREVVPAETLLLEAALHGDEELVLYLLSRGYSVDSRAFVEPDTGDMDRKTINAIQFWWRCGCFETVQKALHCLFLLLGAPVSFWTPLYFRDLDRRVVEPNLCAPGIFKAMFEWTTLPKCVTRKELFVGLMRADNESGVRLLLESGYLKRRDTIEECLAIVQEQFPAKLGIASLLIEKLHRIEVRRPKANVFSLDASSNSAAALKESWTYRTQEDGTLMITGYKGRDTCIEVPARIGRKTVTCVGPYAFSPAGPRMTPQKQEIRKNLKSVRFPETVRSLGHDLFRLCTKLREVTLPSELQTIPNCAFENTYSLETLDIPDSVVHIGAAAFWGAGIQKLHISDNVTHIGDGAFQRSRLKEISLPAAAIQYSSYIIDHYGSSEWGIFKDALSLESVELRGKGIISPHEFENCFALHALLIPEGCSLIGERAFCSSGLKNVYIPSCVERVESGAFEDNFLLEEVFIQNDLELASGVFRGCSQLHSVQLPKNLRRIPNQTFEDCFGLQSIQFPAALEHIGAKAFAGTEVKRREVPKTVKHVASSAFG